MISIVSVNRPHRWFFIFVIFFALCSFVLSSYSPRSEAQFQPGDLVLAPGVATGPQNEFHFMCVTPSGVVTTMKYCNGVTNVPVLIPSPDNQSIWFIGWDYSVPYSTPPGLFRLDQNGIISTLLLGSFSWMEVVDGGDIVLVEPGTGLLRMTVGKVVTTILSKPNFSYHAIGYDASTDDLIIDDNDILSISLYPNRVFTTLLSKTGYTFLSQMAYDVESDALYGSFGSSDILKYDLSTTSISTLPPQQILYQRSISQICYSLSTKKLLISTSHLSTFEAGVVEVDIRSPSRSRILFSPVNGGFISESSTIACSRYISAGLCPQQGGTYPLYVSSPNNPGAYYIIGMSFDTSPGIPLGGDRRILLKPDCLFFYSLTNSGIFRDFQGYLNSSGQAIAYVDIPSLAALSNMRIYTACAIISNNAIICASHTIGATIR